MRSLEDRFWSNTSKGEGCWIYGTGDRAVAPVIGRGGRGSGNRSALRVAWELAHGPVPDEADVTHASHCREKRCVRPDHLRLEARRLDPRERFDEHCIPEPNTGCWLWTGDQTPGGYAVLSYGGRTYCAHRVSYERHIGPIPARLQLDHLCRTRCCVNPAHLEPVSNRENWLRGTSLSAKCAREARCAKGHPYDTANTLMRRDGRRQCRACHRDRERARRAEARP